MADNRDAPRCADCGEFAPQTDTNFTLISSTHGWRLTLTRQGNRKVPTWRCPKCWRKYKEKQTA